MTQSRLLLLVLIALGLVFAIGIGLGATNETTEDSTDENYKKKLLAFLLPLIPKLEIPETIKNGSSVSPISAEAYINIRIAEIEDLGGVKEITFMPDVNGNTLPEQSYANPPAPGVEKFLFIIPPEGGTFKLACPDNSICQVQLKKSKDH